MKAIICDLDGTLCNVDHRRHYVEGPKKDFNSFYEAMGKDTPNRSVAHLVGLYAYESSAEIIFCSGRPERYREITTNWIVENAGINADQFKLFMRPQGKEFTPDNEVKLEIYQNKIKPYYDILFVLDDRDKVVRMWREQGLTCFQVAEGKF
jgi:FMN phosphatase YigB (HAD superfamily)